MILRTASQSAVGAGPARHCYPNYISDWSHGFCSRLRYTSTRRYASASQTAVRARIPPDCTASSYSVEPDHRVLLSGACGGADSVGGPQLPRSQRVSPAGDVGRVHHDHGGVCDLVVSSGAKDCEDVGGLPANSGANPGCSRLFSRRVATAGPLNGWLNGLLKADRS